MRQDTRSNVKLVLTVSAGLNLPVFPNPWLTTAVLTCAYTIIHLIQHLKPVVQVCSLEGRIIHFCLCIAMCCCQRLKLNVASSQDLFMHCSSWTWAMWELSKRLSSPAKWTCRSFVGTFKEVVRRVGRYACSLSCRESDEKIDIDICPLQCEATD